MTRWGIVLVVLLCRAVAASDWPQLQNGPQRLGYSPEKIDVPLQRAWAVGLSPERLHPQAQPVIAGGRLFLGTAMGNFHAFEAKTGKKLWIFPAGGPILHTAGVEAGKVFFGCMDGCVYALDAPEGKLTWKFDTGLRTGVSTAVLLAEGKVFIANRGGVYFALSQKDGGVAWKRALGGRCSLRYGAVLLQDHRPGPPLHKLAEFGAGGGVGQRLLCLAQPEDVEAMGRVCVHRQ